jgi:hypothetical protein
MPGERTGKLFKLYGNTANVFLSKGILEKGEEEKKVAIISSFGL